MSIGEEAFEESERFVTDIWGRSTKGRGSRKTNIWGDVAKHERGSDRWSSRGTNLKRTGNRIGGATSSAMSSEFMRKLPVPLAIGAAAIGVAVTHPMRQVSKQFGTSFEGDPNYLRKLTTAGALGATGLGGYAPGAMGSQPGFGANIMSSGNGPGITSEGNYGYSANPDPDNALRMNEQLPGTNPSGSLVFGLYGNRLK